MSLNHGRPPGPATRPCRAGPGRLQSDGPPGAGELPVVSGGGASGSESGSAQAGDRPLSFKLRQGHSAETTLNLVASIWAARL
jgi:hypothetical protein